MKRCCLITTGMVAQVSGICSVVVGIMVLVAGTKTRRQDVFSKSSNNNNSNVNMTVVDENEYDYHQFDLTQSNRNIGVTTFAGVAIGDGSLWLPASLLLLLFACGHRYEI